ncbi:MULTISPECIES: RNA-directed DNA polymerase [unclassified Nocardioides]|uniref:RNA-directed DNA polymerase n=1 Tax=unclassified Nocardioides TaxID=2615069 RepID=UPI003014917F
MQQDIVLARKVGGGSRPLPFLGLRERLAYRALIGLVTTVGDGSRGDHGAFRKAPLEVEDCRYVLKTDIAAFYQYIDHERLVDEVVAQTGDDLAISTAIELMQASSGRRFGLPQMSVASDALAEVYIDPMRRDLVRAGYSVWRFADDFRVACPNYGSALAALELSERSAYSLGLVLNESKTSTPGRDTYAESLSEVDRAERELFALAHGETPSAADTEGEDKDEEDDQESEVLSIENFFMLALQDYDDLEDDEEESLGDVGGDDEDKGVDTEDADEEEAEDPEPPSERQVRAAQHLLELWADRQDDGELASEIDWSRAAWSVLLRKALAVLSDAKDEVGIEYVSSLLVYEPDITPQVCSYMSALADAFPSSVSSILDEVCERQVVSAWQSVWIAYCAGAVSTPRGGDQPGHVSWLRTRLNDSHGSVAAQAALTLAQRRLLDVTEATETYARVPAVHKQTAFLAMAAASGQVGKEAPSNDKIEALLAAWVQSQQWGRPVIPRTSKRRK